MLKTLAGRIPLPAFTAGFVTVLVGFTSSIAIVFQAANAAKASPEQISSWVLALSVGMGLVSIGLSLRYKIPVVIAWSTPGAALLATSLVHESMAEAIGAFLFCGLLMMLSGMTGWFERIMNRIPLPIASAMLAGILARFGMDVFIAMQKELVLVLTMFGTYLLSKRLWPRYAIILVLITGGLLAWARGLLAPHNFHLALATPVFTVPHFSWQTMIGVGLPLYIVTMAGQNVPGAAILRNFGYKTPISPLITWSGLATLILAPFGCFALNLAAITAAICMGKDVHPDPAKRYIASVTAGFLYMLLGLFGATIAGILASLPKELILAIAGLALFGTIAQALAGSMKEEKLREPALITFLVTLSGVQLFGIASAFWGIIAGALALAFFTSGLRSPWRGYVHRDKK